MARTRNPPRGDRGLAGLGPEADTSPDHRFLGEPMGALCAFLPSQGDVRVVNPGAFPSSECEEEHDKCAAVAATWLAPMRRGSAVQVRPRAAERPKRPSPRRRQTRVTQSSPGIGAPMEQVSFDMQQLSPRRSASGKPIVIAVDGDPQGVLLRTGSRYRFLAVRFEAFAIEGQEFLSIADAKVAAARAVLDARSESRASR